MPQLSRGQFAENRFEALLSEQERLLRRLFLAQRGVRLLKVTANRFRGVRVLRRFRAKLKKMDCEAERSLQISMQKLTGAHQRRCLGPSLRRNLLVSRVLNNVLSSTELSYCAYRTEYKIDVDIDGVKNELLPFDSSKITENQKSTEVKKTANDRKRAKPDVDAVQKKRFKTMTTSFFYGDAKITITDEYFLF